MGRGGFEGGGDVDVSGLDFGSVDMMIKIPGLVS
jgi:hypothetical protein